MHGNFQEQTCWSLNHQMFMDVIICLHVSVKDGPQENQLSACSGGQLHKQLCLRLCGSGGEDGRREKKKRQRE